LIKTALQYLLTLANAQQLQIGGREYVNGSIHPVKPPTQNDLGISTLTAIEDYFRDNPDKIDLTQAVIHIKSHDKVEVVSAVNGEWIQRHEYLTASTTPKQYPFGRYLSIEEFIIAVQSFFLQDDTTAMLLALVGNLSDDTAVRYQDDGITQEVTAKVGIARIGNVPLPNPVVLAPYRTFLEVAQPSSKFVFRLKKGDSGPMAMLVEADGGNWQLQCIKLIRDYLRVTLPTGTTILA